MRHLLPWTSTRGTSDHDDSTRNGCYLTSGHGFDRFCVFLCCPRRLERCPSQESSFRRVATQTSFVLSTDGAVCSAFIQLFSPSSTVADWNRELTEDCVQIVLKFLWWGEVVDAVFIWSLNIVER